MIEQIGEHSVRTDLLSKCAILDAGCRGFEFSRWFAERDHMVYACDPAPDIDVPAFVNHFDRVALLGQSEYHHFFHFKICEDKNASHVAEDGDIIVEARIIQNWNFTKTNPCDVVKLDIEGSEYAVLADWPGPIAKQISVEFHEHCRPRGEETINRIIKHLEQWYRVEQHEKTDQHCAGKNYWDSLFILKELG
jgi:hypothetical protein